MNSLDEFQTEFPRRSLGEALTDLRFSRHEADMQRNTKRVQLIDRMISQVLDEIKDREKK